MYNYWFLVLLTFTPAHGFPAYDCTSKGANYTMIDLTDVEQCAVRASEYFPPSTSKIQIIQELKEVESLAYRCKITRSSKVVRCGFNSLTYGEQWPEFEKLLDITPSECRVMVKDQVFTYQDQKIPFQINIPRHIALDTEGKFLSDGSCEVSTFWRSGVQYKNSVETTFLRLEIMKVRARVSTSENVIIFSDGVRSSYTDLMERDAINGVYIWEKLEEKCIERYQSLYYGQATFYNPRNPDQMQTLILVQDSLSQQYAGFTLKNSLTVCGVEGYMTQVKGINIVKLREHDLPVSVTPLSPTGLREHSDTRSQLGFLHISTQIRLGSNFQRVAESLCELDREILQTKLHMPALNGKQVSGSNLWGHGKHVKVAGSALYLTQCELVEVTRRDAKNCTNEIPITWKNQSMYVDPLTRIITPSGQLIPCDPLYPARWQIGEQWYCSYPNFIPCEGPKRLKPRYYDEVRFSPSVAGLDGGLYSKEQWDQHARAMMFQDSREALVSNLTSYSLGNHDSGIGINGLVTSNDIDHLTSLMGYKIIPFFHYLGYSYTVVLGIVMIAQVILFFLNSFLRAGRIYAAHGCTWKIVMAIWSIGFQLLMFPTRYFTSAEKHEEKGGSELEEVRPQSHQAVEERIYPSVPSPDDEKKPMVTKTKKSNNYEF